MTGRNLMTRDRTTALLRCTVAGTLALAALTACTSVVEGTAQHSSPASSAAARAATPGSVLESIALKRSDLPTATVVSLVPGGDEVDGEVTLDNCGFDFTTEAHRVARRQYAIAPPSDRAPSASNELVAYDSAAHAAQAVAQWHRAAATCPKGPVHSTVDAVPDLTIRVTRNALHVRALPVAHNAVTVESARTAEGDVLYNCAILQVHGRYLDVVYLNASTAIGATALAHGERLAAITGRRLARLH